MCSSTSWCCPAVCGWTTIACSRRSRTRCRQLSGRGSLLWSPQPLFHHRCLLDLCMDDGTLSRESSAMTWSMSLGLWSMPRSIPRRPGRACLIFSILIRSFICLLSLPGIQPPIHWRFFRSWQLKVRWDEVRVTHLEWSQGWASIQNASELSLHCSSPEWSNKIFLNIGTFCLIWFSIDIVSSWPVVRWGDPTAIRSDISPRSTWPSRCET